MPWTLPSLLTLIFLPSDWGTVFTTQTHRRCCYPCHHRRHRQSIWHWNNCPPNIRLCLLVTRHLPLRYCWKYLTLLKKNIRPRAPMIRLPLFIWHCQACRLCGFHQDLHLLILLRPHNPRPIIARVIRGVEWSFPRFLSCASVFSPSFHHTPPHFFCSWLYWSWNLE